MRESWSCRTVQESARNITSGTLTLPSYKHLPEAIFCCLQTCNSLTLGVRGDPHKLGLVMTDSRAGTDGVCECVTHTRDRDTILAYTTLHMVCIGNSKDSQAAKA